MLRRCGGPIRRLLLRRAATALAAFLADAAIELGALLPLGGLATLLADFSIEGWAKLLFYGFAALLADTT